MQKGSPLEPIQTFAFSIIIAQLVLVEINDPGDLDLTKLCKYPKQQMLLI